MRRGRRRSGYPNGMRHEGLSAQITRHPLDDPDQDPEADPDPVLHLVVSHHGRSRDDRRSSLSPPAWRL
jgi:CRISPR-associated endonuclease/helicase Cas3